VAINVAWPVETSCCFFRFCIISLTLSLPIFIQCPA